MPDLIERVETEVLVDHGTFDLIDDSGEQHADPDPTSTTWLLAGRNMITVVSASTRHHVAALTVEAWNAEPPPAPGWTDPRETPVLLDSGFLEINPLPGLNPESGDLCYLAYRLGLTHPDLIELILDAALARYGLG